MDSLKPFLQNMWTNRFWIACGLIAVVSLVTWYLASSSLNTERKKNKQTLDQQDSAIKNVLTTTAEVDAPVNEAVSVHPNDQTQTGMDQEIDVASDVALEAWNLRFDQQKDLLKFAEVLPDPVRKQLEAFYKNPETIQLDKADPIGEGYRDTFAVYIKKRMPVLAAKIGTSWKHDPAKEDEEDAGEASAAQPNPGIGGAGRPGSGQPAAPSAASSAPIDEIVIWDDKNQDLWNDKVTVFAGKNGNQDANNRPSTVQMLAVQQDIWILEAMLDIVKEVNGDAEANDLAPIKKLDHILVGQDAYNDEMGELHRKNIQLTAITSSGPSNNASGSGLEGGFAAPTKQRYGATQSRARAQAAAQSGAAKAFEKKESDSPYHGRYVDRNYTRLSENDLKRVLNATKLSNDSYLAVAKRVPIRIAMIMDERRIGDFLEASANSPFNFEIRVIRINKHKPGEGVEVASGGAKSGFDAGLGRAGGPGGGGVMADSNSAADPGSGGGSGGVADPSAVSAEQRTHFDIKIEFAGIIKMYNPVDGGVFGKKQASADDGSATPAITN